MLHLFTQVVSNHDMLWDCHSVGKSFSMHCFGLAMQGPIAVLTCASFCLWFCFCVNKIKMGQNVGEQHRSFQCVKCTIETAAGGFTGTNWWMEKCERHFFVFSDANCIVIFLWIFGVAKRKLFLVGIPIWRNCLPEFRNWRFLAVPLMIVLKKDLWRPGPNSQPSHNCLTVCVTVHLSSGTKAWNDAAQNVGCTLCAPKPNTGWQWMTNVFCVKRWTEVFEVFDPQVLLHFFHIYISIWENVCQCCLIHTRTHSHTHTHSDHFFWHASVQPKPITILGDCVAKAQRIARAPANAANCQWSVVAKPPDQKHIQNRTGKTNRNKSDKTRTMFLLNVWCLKGFCWDKHPPVGGNTKHTHMVLLAPCIVATMLTLVESVYALRSATNLAVSWVAMGMNCQTKADSAKW